MTNIWLKSFKTQVVLW